MTTISCMLRCFLPVWEGGSQNLSFFADYFSFPPCMGGWIALREIKDNCGVVSSLYGRVDRKINIYMVENICFLPVWEGGS